MYIRVTYDSEFEDLMMYLRSKYPQKLFDLDGIGEQTDMSKFSKKFFASNTTADASIDANANVDDVSVIAYNTELPKPFFRLNSYYILWKELRRLYGLLTANTIIEKQLTGDIYIHDFHGIASGIPYCFNYSTYDIMTKGLPMVKKIKSIQPKYLYSFKSQLEQFVVIASNSTLGATGLADLLITMSYYAKQILKTKKDAHFAFATESDCWNYIRETLVSFIYTINQPMRANQSPFTNVSVYDKYFLEEFSKDYIFPDGSSPEISVINELLELYLDVMNKEMERTPVTFPITTACFSIDENGNIMDKEFKHIVAFYNQKFGFINIYNGSTATLSSCCRLRSNKDNEYFNSFGSGSSKIGSLGVCTINLPRLAFLADRDINKFKNGLVENIEICAKVNNAKRHVIRKRLENGNLPLYSLGFLDINKQYSTVGVNGFYEAIKILGSDILNEDGQRLGLEIINTINDTNDKFEKQYSAPHNCEQVPAENVAIKLASKDKLLKVQDEYDIYSNQFIPLTTKANMLDRIYLQGKFDSEFSGGAICHINIDTPIDDVFKIEELIEATAKNGVVYWAINYNLQQCEDGHMTVGKRELCSICGKRITDNYTRVVGFLTNTKNWHQVRREQDYPNRQFYSETI